MTTPSRPGAAVEIREATAEDLPLVQGLLTREGLPLDGLDETLAGLMVAESRGEVVGAAGLEVHGAHGVLRSVVVAPSARGQGLGRELSAHVIRQAQLQGLGRIYLLTTTAESYFPRLGFRPISRAQVSPAVQESVEFRQACPASAVAMVLELATPEVAS